VLGYTVLMLRKITIWLVILIILLQFPGFPYEVTRWGSLASGFIIVILLAVSKRGKMGNASTNGWNETPRTLRIERRETEEYPRFSVTSNGQARVRVEKEMTIETEQVALRHGEDVAVERKVTVTRPPEQDRSQSGTSRKKSDADVSPGKNI